MRDKTELNQAQHRPEATRLPASTPGARRPLVPRTRHPLLILQQQLGNRAVGQWLQTKLRVGSVDDRYEREAERAAEEVMHGSALSRQHTCTCGGACSECKAASLGQPDAVIQTSRMHAGAADASIAPVIVHEVLRAPGQSLDPAARAFLEPRFGRDFSQVRVHTNALAAASAQSIDASAYTVGRHIVFGEGHYAPHTRAGQKLLAHELTHIVQQGNSSVNGYIRRQSESALDEHALRIITLAQDSTRDIADRAVAVVRAIINQYYPGDVSKVSRIVFEAGEAGLMTTYTGTGSALTGIITVGRYFVENTTRTGLARRIAQVRHEIEHVEQQRAGMSGQNRSAEREFFAFYHEALFQELPHTGRISHSTRVSLIDAALGYYFCLSQQLQQDNRSRRDELVARRATEVRATGRADEIPAAPTTCRRQGS